MWELVSGSADISCGSVRIIVRSVLTRARAEQRPTAIRRSRRKERKDNKLTVISMINDSHSSSRK